MLENTLESPLDCKEIQPGHPKGDQSWVFFGRNDAKAKTPVLWPHHAKSWLIGKDSDAGRDWGQEEKGTTEDEMAGWHHWLDGYEFGWTPGVGDRQGGLACCNSWGRKESDTTEWLNWTELSWSLSLAPVLPQEDLVAPQTKRILPGPPARLFQAVKRVLRSPASSPGVTITQLQNIQELGKLGWLTSTKPSIFFPLEAEFSGTRSHHCALISAPNTPWTGWKIHTGHKLLPEIAMLSPPMIFQTWSQPGHLLAPAWGTPS